MKTLIIILFFSTIKLFGIATSVVYNYKYVGIGGGANYTFINNSDQNTEGKLNSQYILSYTHQFVAPSTMRCGNAYTYDNMPKDMVQYFLKFNLSYFNNNIIHNDLNIKFDNLVFDMNFNYFLIKSFYSSLGLYTNYNLNSEFSNNEFFTKNDIKKLTYGLKLGIGYSFYNYQDGRYTIEMNYLLPFNSIIQNNKNIKLNSVYINFILDFGLLPFGVL